MGHKNEGTNGPKNAGVETGVRTVFKKNNWEFLGRLPFK